MRTEPSFMFYLSVSRQAFAAKPKDGQISKLIFERRQLTIDSLLQCVLEGRAFCYNFTSNNRKGLIAVKDKKGTNFLSTFVIFFDFDDMIVGMHEFIESLPYPPTLAYVTYSDGVKGLRRYRLVYIFTKPVTSEESFYALYHAIANANGFVKEEKGKGGLDVRGVSQLYFGTFSTASTYKSGTIYCQEDFSQSVFIATGKGNAVFDSTNTQDIIDPFITTTMTNVARYEMLRNPDAHFLSDFKYLSTLDFLHKYWDEYHPNYELSISSQLILDESEMFYRYPEEYYCIYRKWENKRVKKWPIGSDRKEKIFEAALIMLRNLPSLTIENLLYNLKCELHYYYRNDDNKISNDYLIQMAIDAYKRPFTMAPSRHPNFSVNKEYWAERGYTPNQVKCKIQYYLRTKEVNKFYNPELTIPENVNVLEEHGIRISERTLERMVKYGDIEISKGRGAHTLLSRCPDSVTIRILQLIGLNERITQPEIAAELNVDPRTVKGYMKEMKGVCIERIGNSRTGIWKILPAFQDYADHKKVDNAMVTEDCSIPSEHVSNVSQSYSETCIASWETSQFNPTEHAAEIQNITDGVGCKIIADGAEQNHEQVFLRHVPMPLKIESIVRRTG